jgi:IPT/TIG domain
MANDLSPYTGPGEPFSWENGNGGRGRSRSTFIQKQLFWFLVAAVLLAPLVFAQASPHVSAVDPSSGKVKDRVTLTGENLGKDLVPAVFLSDETVDYKATIVDQTGEKIVMEVPQVKPGEYNVSIQVGNKILILPIRFKVG